MRAERDLRRYSFYYRRMIMPENQSSVTAEIIDVFVSVGVPFVRARGARDIDRVGLPRYRPTCVIPFGSRAAARA